MSNPISNSINPLDPFQYAVTPADVASTKTLSQTGSTLSASTTSGLTETLKLNLPAPTISWIDYLSVVASNLATAKRSTQAAQIADDLSTQQQYIVLAQQALNNVNLLQVLQQEIIQASNKAATAAANLNNLIPQVNQAIDYYNNGTGNQASFVNSGGDTVTVTNNGLDTDSSEYNKLQQALASYNTIINDPNSTPDQITQAQSDLNDAITRYNLYVSIRQPDIDYYNSIAAPANPGGQGNNYNSYAAQFNSAIQSLNQIGSASGVDPIPEQPTLSTVQNINTYTGVPLPAPSTASISHVPTPDSSLTNAQDLYQNYYQAVLNALKQALKNASNHLQNTENFNDFIKYFIGNLAKAGASPAYIQLSVGSKEKPGASGSTTGFAQSLSNTDLIRIVSQSLRTTENITISDPSKQIVTPEAINQLGIAFLQQLGLSAVIPSIALLAEKFATLSPGDSALDTALQATALTQLVGALNTTSVLNELDAALKLRFPDLTDAQIAALSAGLKLALVVSSSAILANSLNQPGLISQLLALASGLSEEAAIAAQNQPVEPQTTTEIPSTNSTSSNPSAPQDAAIQAAQTTQQEAQRRLADAIRQDQQRINNFQDSVLASVKQQGIQADQASAAEQVRTDLNRSNIQAQNLAQQQINSDNLRADVLSQSISSQLLQANIVKSNQQAQEIAKQVSNNVFGGSSNLTSSQIRNAINTNLSNIVPGITTNQAESVAQKAAIVTVPPEGTNPLSQPIASQGLTKPELALNLTESTINQLSPSLGYTKAAELASSVTQAQIGAADKTATQNNALEVITDQVHFISSLQKTAEAQLATQTVNQFVNENSGISELAAKINDPGQSLLHSQHVGIMYGGPEPTKGSGQARDVSPLSVILA